MPDLGVVDTGDGGRVFLSELLDLAGVEHERGLRLAIVELGAPHASLGLEGVEEGLRPRHVVAGRALMVVHDTVRVEEVVQEVEGDGSEDSRAEEEGSAGAAVASDT